MHTSNPPLPPGTNAGMFADNSNALLWGEYSWQQHVASQTMNMPQSFLFPGVSVLENTLVFELPVEINVPGRMLLFNAIREIMSRYWDSFFAFIQKLIDGGMS